MRNLAFVAWAQLALASLSYAATPPKKTTHSPATPAPATAAAKSSAKPVAKPAPKIATKAPPPRARTYYRYRAPARPVVQQVPTPERYREIQQALADKGYFKGTVDGQWSADSVDALKHFQADQNLQSDGKLDSLSLIGLGLGPKRMTAQSAPPLDKQ
ncbi:MAG TPA: peptidoglycan-binding domain-containing protein [Bryobacteraceae bacterium]|nr:peptidoglycan-binding domain-containing protein [Bryobacteraceae bacterium]